MRYYLLLFVVLFFSCSEEGEQSKAWTKSDKKVSKELAKEGDGTSKKENKNEKVKSSMLVLDFKFPQTFAQKKVDIQYHNGRDFQPFLSVKIDQNGRLTSSFNKLNETLYRLIVDRDVIFMFPDTDTISANVFPRKDGLELGACNSFETSELQAYTLFKNSIDAKTNPSAAILNYLKDRPAFYIDYLYASELVIDYRGNYDFFDRLKTEFSDKNKYPYAKDSDLFFQTKASEIVLKNPTGKVIRLSDYVGKVVVLDFWASWCAPCRQINPAMVELNKAYQDKNVQFLGVSLDVSKDSWIKAIDDDELSWPQVSDLKKWDGKVVKDYMITSIPQVVIIDQNGQLVTKVLGEESGSKEAIDKIKKVLNELIEPNS